MLWLCRDRWPEEGVGGTGGKVASNLAAPSSARSKSSYFLMDEERDKAAELAILTD